MERLFVKCLNHKNRDIDLEPYAGAASFYFRQEGRPSYHAKPVQGLREIGFDKGMA